MLLLIFLLVYISHCSIISLEACDWYMHGFQACLDVMPQFVVDSPFLIHFNYLIKK